MKKQIGSIILILGALCLVFMSGIFIGRCSLKSTKPQQTTVHSAAHSATSPTIRDKRININTADAQTLQSLPGIGEVLAQRIIDYRTENGPFTSVHDLEKVEGIGAKKVLDIIELIYVED